jgi:hypothetical protein
MKSGNPAKLRCCFGREEQMELESHPPQTSVKKGFSFGPSTDASVMKSQFSFVIRIAVTSHSKEDSETKEGSPVILEASATFFFSTLKACLDFHSASLKHVVLPI